MKSDRDPDHVVISLNRTMAAVGLVGLLVTLSGILIALGVFAEQHHGLLLSVSELRASVDKISAKFDEEKTARDKLTQSDNDLDKRVTVLEHNYVAATMAPGRARR